MRDRQLNSTTHPMTFLMVLSSDHITGAIGLTPTVTISKDGGAFASPSGAVTEIGNGWYSLAANSTDRNTLGGFLLHATAATADPSDRDFTIVAYDPFNSTTLGLSSLAAIGTPMQAGSPVALTSAGLDAVIIETGLNARQSLSIIASAAAGVGGDTSGTYKGAGVATTRITYTATTTDRTSVTLSPPT